MTMTASAASAAEPVVTIADPAGPVVIDADTFGHWRAIAARGNESVAPRDLDAEVLSFLISNAWILGEARQRGIVVSEADVATLLRQQRMQSFPSAAAYQRFLRESGLEEADLLRRVAVQETSARLRAALVAPVAVTSEQITAYLRQHPQRVAERRDLLLLATRTRAAALQALGALQAGRTFRSVARRFSVHPSRRRGGVVARAEFYDFGGRLAKRIFGAARGTVVGPVRVGRRWFLFRVLRVHPAHPMSPGPARRRGRQIVLARAQQRALDTFVKDFQAAWRARTTCAPAYTWITDSCGNAGGR